MFGPLFDSQPSRSGGGAAASRAKSTGRAGKKEKETTRIAALALVIEQIPADVGVGALTNFTETCKERFTGAQLRENIYPIASLGKDRAAAFVDLVVHSRKTASTTLEVFAERLPDLQQIFERGASDSSRFVRMAKAVISNREDRSLLPRLIDAFKDGEKYQGTTYELEAFCNKMGSQNPFEAARNARVIWPTRSEDNEGGVAGVKTRADSTGGMMTSTNMYRVKSATHPELPYYKGGIQGLIQIMSYFHPEEAQRRKWQRTDETKKQLQKDLGDEVKKKILSELLDSPRVRKAHELMEEEAAHAGTEPKTGDAAEVERSLTIKRKQAILDALNKEIEAALNERELLTSIGRDIVPAGRQYRAYKVELQTSGVWLKWFERELGSKGTNVPDEISDAYRQLTDPHAGLSVRERDYYTRALVIYQARRSYINRDLGLADIKSDLEWYEDFHKNNPGDHPLCREFGVPGMLVREGKSILDSEDDSISFADLRASEAAFVGLGKLRARVNQEVFAPFERDFQRALGLLAPLFKEANGQWREDSQEESLPMERRLRSTIAGLVLTYDELHAVREALRYSFLTRPEEGTQQFFGQMCIRDFSSMLRRTVLAGRKMEHFVGLMKKNGIELGEETVAAQASSEVEELKGEAARGSKFKLVEDELKLSREEVAERVRKAFHIHEAFGYQLKLSPLLPLVNRDQLEAGICGDKGRKALLDLLKLVTKSPHYGISLLPARDFLSEIATIAALKEFPGINRIEGVQLPSSAQEGVLSKDGAQAIQNAARLLKSRVEELTQALELDSEKKRSAFSAELAHVRGRRPPFVFLQGGIREYMYAPKGGAPFPLLRLEVKARSFDTVASPSGDPKKRSRWEEERPILHKDEEGSVVVSSYDPEVLRSLLDSFQASEKQGFSPRSSWVAWDKLPAEWIAAAKLISSFEFGRTLGSLRTKGEGLRGSSLDRMGASDRDTWKIFEVGTDFSSTPSRARGAWNRLASQPSSILVSREIYEEVNKIAEELQRRGVVIS